MSRKSAGVSRKSASGSMKSAGVPTTSEDRVITLAKVADVPQSLVVRLQGLWVDYKGFCAGRFCAGRFQLG